MIGWFKRRPQRVARKKSFVAEVDWARVEELRPDRLGPGREDIDDKDESFTLPVDPDRPQSTLNF